MRQLPTVTREARGGEPAAEQGLVHRARAGDRAAFDDLVRLHFGPVYALLYRMLQNHEDAEDVTQESFVRAWHALPGYRGEAAFSTWVSRIGIHLASEVHRRRGRALALEIGAAEDLCPPAKGGAGAEASAGEMVAALTRALDRLPARLRAAIVLRTLEDREYGEIAQVLGVRPATARAHVMQARKLLLRWLAPWMDEGGAR